MKRSILVVLCCIALSAVTIGCTIEQKTESGGGSAPTTTTTTTNPTPEAKG